MNKLKTGSIINSKGKVFVVLEKEEGGKSYRCIECKALEYEEILIEEIDSCIVE